MGIKPDSGQSISIYVPMFMLSALSGLVLGSLIDFLIVKLKSVLPDSHICYFILVLIQLLLTSLFFVSLRFYYPEGIYWLQDTSHGIIFFACLFHSQSHLIEDFKILINV